MTSLRVVLADDITDIRVPPTPTDEGIRDSIDIRERHPDIGVVVLSR